MPATGRLIGDMAAQFRRLTPVFLILYLPVLVLLAGLFFLWLFTEVAIADLTRDPLAVVETELLKIQRNPDAGIHDLAQLDLPFYMGAISNLGLLIWAATASITAFSFFLLRSRKAPLVPPSFFLWTALLSTILLLDDMFLIHERAVPLTFNLNEKYVFAAYGLFIVLYLARWRSVIYRSEYLILGFSFFFFTVSLGVDLLPLAIPQPHFFEDGAKLAGIVSWAGYQIRLARSELETLLA